MGWEANIRKVVPYTPGEQPKDRDIIKLNTNENPYPPSPEVEKALRHLKAEDLRLYPDPAASGLVHAIAAEHGLRDEEVFAGVGSDEVLALCFLTFFNGTKPVLFPDITYSFYDVWADLYRIPYRQIPLDGEFAINPEDYAVENGGVIFPNPNAPTGRLMPPESVESIISANPDSIVIVDEAYIDFGGTSAVPLIRKYPNLVVVQTFSKSRNLAGMRIGYACADPKLIRYLSDVKYSFNSYTLNRTSLALGEACMKDREYFAGCCAKITATRERTAEGLRRLGFTFNDSAANFLFISHPDMPAAEIFKALKARKIYVRWWDKDRIRNHLRVTIGTDTQMNTLIAALADILAGRLG